MDQYQGKGRASAPNTDRFTTTPTYEQVSAWLKAKQYVEVELENRGQVSLRIKSITDNVGPDAFQVNGHIRCQDGNGNDFFHGNLDAHSFTLKY